MKLIDLDGLAKASPALQLFLSRAKLVHEPQCPTAGTALDASGQLTCYIGDQVLEAPLAAQVEILKHELAHVIGRFWERLDTLDPRIQTLFNMAHDAAIHAAGCCDVELIDKALGADSVTCDRLGVEEMPAEEIYQELLKKTTIIAVSSCGRGEFLEQMAKEGKILDPKEHPIGEKLSEAFQSALANQLYAGTEPGKRELTGTLPPTPNWARKLYRYLEEFAGEDRYPERSWQRGASRRYPLLPGWPRVQPSRSALLMLDASGSMSDAVLLQAIAAAQSVGLSVKARVWSTHISAELPPEPSVLREEIGRHGGGTEAVKCSKVIEREQCVIWISDAESADGLPPQRKGWIWVVTSSPEQEPIFVPHPTPK